MVGIVQLWAACLFAPDKQPSWFTAVAKGDEPLVNDFEYVTQDVPNYSENRSAALELLSIFDTFRMYRGECENGEDCLSVSIDIWYNDESCWRQFNGNGQYKDVALLICQAAIEATKVK